MATFQLPFFGLLDIDALEEYYSAPAEWNGQSIKLDLNFKHKHINAEVAEDIRVFLQHISVVALQNKSAILHDFQAQGEASDYVRFFFEELEEEDLDFLHDYGDDDKPKEEQLLDCLRLLRVGIYPDNNRDNLPFGVFDYSINIHGEPSNQLLVVKTEKTGKPVLVTWES